MKNGVNYQDRNAIRRYVVEGILDIDTISQNLQIKPSVVERVIGFIVDELEDKDEDEDKDDLDLDEDEDEDEEAA